MEPITTAIMPVVAQYAQDKAGQLVKEVGDKAYEKAKEIFQRVLARLRRKPDGEVIAKKFEEKPEKTQALVEDELNDEVKSDQDFAAQLSALLEQYKQALKEHGGINAKSYEANLTGSGAIAQDHSVAAGKDGIAVGGSVHGGIHTTGRSKETDMVRAA